MSFEKISFDSVLDDLEMLAVNAGVVASGSTTGNNCCNGGGGSAQGNNCCNGGGGSATGDNCCNGCEMD